MKDECDIVRDLLFSYDDGVLSMTSKEFVDEHLKKCEDCRNVLEEIKQENNNKKEFKEIDFFKKVKKKINTKNILIIISLIFILIIISFNVLIYKNYNDIASTMEIYLNDDITDEELDNIKNRVMNLSHNIELEYISKEKALERMKNNFAESQNLLEGYEENNNPFPASIEIKTDTKIQKVVEGIKDMPGIKQINTHLNYNPYNLFISNFLGKMFRKDVVIISSINNS